MINDDYFEKKPENEFNNVLQLLEHIVFVFDLYEDEELEKMHAFLNTILKQRGMMSKSFRYIYIIDQWKMQLFRKHIENMRSEVSLNIV